MKTCMRCGAAKPLTEFHNETRSPDGKTRWCKTCRHAALTRWKQANRERCKEHARAANRTYRQRHWERVNAYARQYRKGHPEMNREVQRRWRVNNPQAHRAQKLLRRAVEAGKVLKPTSCPQCGSAEHVSAHHFDYSKPLDVVWLCHRCHMAIHAPEWQR
jgi:hypothetical protein